MKDPCDGEQNHGAFSIRNSNTMPHYLGQLRDWFEAEWEQVDSFEGNHAGVTVPTPIIAVDDQQLLLGGLSFTTFHRPESARIGVWISALLVAPTHRKKGIASQLIRSAEHETNRLNLSELFVLTDLPILYQRLGWTIVGTDRDNTILSKVLLDG